MRLTVFIIFWSMLPLFLSGQSNERAIARDAFEKGAYVQALPYYARGVDEKGSKKMHFRYGVSAVHIPSERTNGIATLEELAGKDGMSKALFWAAVGHQSAGRHDKALDLFYRYQKNGDDAISSYELERRIQISVRAKVFRKDQVHVSKRRLRFPEGLEAGRAFLTHRRSRVIFQGATEYGVGKGPVYIAELQEAGAKLKDSVLLDGKDMALAGIASNGEVLILKGRREKDGRMQEDLFFVKEQEGGWSSPEAFGASVNTPADESSAWMKSNERLMIFSSARKGGQGGQDLYIVKRLPTGDWAKARDLSPVLNTAQDELFPCLMPDERTLYFLSGGHRSMGGRDLFRSYFKADSKRWVAAHNPGYPVNSSDDERAVSVSANEGHALITRSVSTPPFRRTERVKLLYQDAHIRVLKGKVLDAANGDPIKAKLRVLDPQERSVQGVYRNRSDDGSFVLAIRPNKTYELIVEADGYVPKTTKASVADKGLRIELERK